MGQKRKQNRGDAVFLGGKKGREKRNRSTLESESNKSEEKERKKASWVFLRRETIVLVPVLGVGTEAIKLGRKKSKKRKSTLVLCSCPFVPFSYL